MSRLFNFFIRLLSRLPFWMLYLLSDMLFWPVFYIVRYRRKVVRQNLTESFPDKPMCEIKKIERKFYHHLIDTILEAVKLATISPEEMKRRMHFTNIEQVNEILKTGKSLSVYIGHYGNWEWISSSGMWLNMYAHCIQIYHRLNNPEVDALMNSLRERFGNECVDMTDTVRYVARWRNQHSLPLILGLIADQSPKHMFATHFFEFLNHRVPVLTGTEKLTKHFDFGAMFLRIRPIKRGYYEGEFVTMQLETKNIPDFDLTQQYIDMLQEEINDKPEYYLWSHKRFKFADPPTPLRPRID